MTSWLEVPTPGGDLAAMREAQSDLDRRAEIVHAGSVELARLARDVSSDWVGRTAETFDLRVVAARTAIDGVRDTHHHAARLIGQYCDEWDVAEGAARQAHDHIDGAFDAYVRDGRSRAQTLADEVRRAIEGLDDPVEDIPIIGGLASTATGVLTDGLGRLAEEVIERLLDWNPSTPSPTYRPILDDEVVVDTVESIADSIGSAFEWSIDRLLEGIDQVIEVVGGAIEWAVDALRAVGDALVDAIAAGLRLAEDAMNALLDLGRQIATTVGELAVEAARIVFDAVVDGLEATIDFLVSLGKGLADVLEFMLDLNITLTLGLLLLIRSKFSRQDRRMSDDEAKALDRQALRRLRSDEHLADVIARSDLAASAYHDTGAPEGWERLENYPGTDGFFAASFRNPETGEVVLAFRGSEPDFDIKDWRDDVINAHNLPTAQARQAIDVARQFASDNPGADLSFSGHSLGGSLASTASVATGIPASTYNAAGIGDSNYRLAVDQYTLDHGGDPSESQITNYHTSNDILTQGQDALGLRPAAGAQVTIQSTTDDDPGIIDFISPGLGAIDELIDSGKGHAQDSFDWDSVGGRPR